MPAPICITDDMVAREFRLQRCPGSALDAITNPIVRRCLELGASVRAARESESNSSNHRDAKLLAANDLD
ncbi:hypothetical protein ACT2FY_13105 [Paraburkholderia fungorum]|uniref:hypothetical protein n=1 Tax=Paraburkholderia fungorum TaxID=134537 RepID=UPI00402B7C7A